ncbi:ABC transporter ATP-binding protein [Silvimonas iriomotensis]|uniref:ABC transporter ATP-binding protein n=1 Tax=Silvimonas iriomotensis TaxID=449662 RepID=A0ABQ2P9D9_9NEIS|nr:sn-glycerol-3-phosphate ABC transporter ATP-binding protein UgpC [Silvimonas iriomotensis]GGP21127.1 ABC transporter ATP-binding protein [Silvimonas iriomotensis]
MNRIEIEHLYKAYGPVEILKDINIAVPQGQFVALIGPSGCGKSTLLRTIAGLEQITGGTLKIDGNVVNKTPPRKRDVAMVFQSYALYPHMNIEKNMSYSLRLKRSAPQVIKDSISNVAQTLGLTHLLERMPRQLSGGQRQRVAMGRAIVRNPKVFLFDEPLSNLDAALRVHMRSEIRKLHNRLNATSVYVTHDQVEAMTMADHVVVLRAGKVEQQGKPLDLYDRPANKFVGGFIGSPAMNFIEGRIGANGRSVQFGASHAIDIGRELPVGKPVWLGMRPEHLQLEGNGQILRCRVDNVESTGSVTFVEVQPEDSNDTPMLITHAGKSPVVVGEHVNLFIDTANLHLFDRETEQAI